KCLSGVCDASWKTNTNTFSPDTGAACTPVGTQLTTIQCRPNLAGFQAPLPVNLTPLTSGTVSKTAGNGIFCPTDGQLDAGDCGQPTAQCVQGDRPGGRQPGRRPRAQFAPRVGVLHPADGERGGGRRRRPARSGGDRAQRDGTATLIVR